MSKIKDFLKSPLGTALCAAAACLLAVVLVWLAAVRPNNDKSLSERISDDYSQYSAELDEANGAAQTFDTDNDLLAMAFVFGTSNGQPTGELHLELADAEDTGNIEDILKYNCTGVKDDRQIEDGVHHNDDEREHQLGAAAKACFHQLRDGGRAHFEVGRQEPQCQCKQREQCTDLPADRTHIGSPALTVCADQLFCGQVGQQQRACNDNTRQSAPREEVSLGGVELVISGLPR